MADNDEVDFGTPERRGRGNLKMEPRDISNGGRVVTTGLTERDSSALDHLFNRGCLGDGESGSRRYGAGLRLWQLFMQFGDTQQTKDIGTPGRGTAGSSLVMAGDIGDSSDLAESIYHAVMAALPFTGRIIRVVCIDGFLNWPCAVNTHWLYLEQLNDALDRLEDVLEKVESRVRKKFEDRD